MVVTRLESEEISQIIDAKLNVILDKKFSDFETTLSSKIINLLKDELTKEFKNIFDEQNEKIVQLDSQVQLLREHVNTLKMHNTNIQLKQDDLESIRATLLSKNWWG